MCLLIILRAELLSFDSFAFSHPPHSLAVPLPVVRPTCDPSPDQERAAG